MEQRTASVTRCANACAQSTPIDTPEHQSMLGKHLLCLRQKWEFLDYLAAPHQPGHRTCTKLRLQGIYLHLRFGADG